MPRLQNLLPLLCLCAPLVAAELPALSNLPEGLRSRFVNNGNGLRMHVLEAGDPNARQCVILLHGFPELAYSWRRIMPALGAAGYYVVAPDQRGFGRTTGNDNSFDTDLSEFRMLNRVRDVIGLVYAIGRTNAFIVGHDAGTPVASYCALIRPNIFSRLVMVTSPFGGAPNIANGKPPIRDPIVQINGQLAKLPKPRKHYQVYYTTREANEDMMHAPQGLHAFLRGYFHQKSGDWTGNKPFKLTGWTAEQFAQIPTYYVMDATKTMAETVAAEMPSATAIAANRWLPDEELAVFVREYQRTTFQGGLNWYRANVSGTYANELEVFSGVPITVPACYIVGEKDWGNYQFPGAFERMTNGVVKDLRGVHFVPNAGHWVQQEAPEAVSRLFLAFFADQ